MSRDPNDIPDRHWPARINTDHRAVKIATHIITWVSLGFLALFLAGVIHP